VSKSRRVVSHGVSISNLALFRVLDLLAGLQTRLIESATVKETKSHYIFLRLGHIIIAA
jgi:hypothetical protein